MTEDEFYAAVVAAVTQIQEQSQRDLPPLRRDTRIVADVPGCDSLAVVEIAIVLTDILGPILGGREIPDCILRGNKEGAHPTLSEIACGVQAFVEKGTARRVTKTKGKPSEAGNGEPDEPKSATGNCRRKELVEVASDISFLKEIIEPSEFDGPDKNLPNGNDHHE